MGITQMQKRDAAASVLRVVRELTGAPTASLAAETPLMEAGVDSLAATELSSRLRALAASTLSPTLIFEQPTPRAIAAHLLQHAEDGVGDSCIAPALVSVRPQACLEVAVPVGRWPGGLKLQGTQRS